MQQLLRFYQVTGVLFLSYLTTAAQTYLPDPAFQSLLVKKYAGGINAITVQSDQKILLAGYMDYLDDTPAGSIVRIRPDGSIDNTFRVPKEVESIQVMNVRPDGKILTGGLFYGKESVFRFFLLKANGDVDSTYITSVRCDYFESNAFAILPDQKLVIGTNTFGITGIQGQVHRLFADGRIDTTFDIGDAKIYSIQALAVQSDGKILVLGDMQDPNLPIGYNTSIIRLQANGSVDHTFQYHAGNQLYAISLQDDGKILLGRNGYSESDHTGLTRLNPDGTLDGTFQAGNGDTTYYDVRAIVIQPDGKILASTWRPGSSRVGYGRGQVARFLADGRVDSTFTTGEGAEYAIPLLALQKDGNVLAGGYFNTFNGKIQTALVRLQGKNGLVDNTFPFKIEKKGFVQAVASQSDNKVLVGGNFETANNASQYYLTRLQPNGQVDPAFSIGSGVDEYRGSTSGQINAIAVQPDDKIWVGGYFTSFNGQQTNSLIRLKANGSTDATFSIPTGDHYQVNDILIQPDNKILVAATLAFSKDSSQHLIRLHPNGAIDSSFRAGPALPEGAIKILLQTDGKILVLHYVTRNYNATARRIIRLHTDGTPDTTFAPYETESTISTMALQPDGRLVISGTLTMDESLTSYRILRLGTNGRVDSTFKFRLDEKDYIWQMTSQADGKLLLTGSFPSFNQPIIRLQANGTLDSSLVFQGLEKLENTGKVLLRGDALFLTYDQAHFMKLIQQKPLGTESLANSLVKLYPNPARDQFNLAIPRDWRLEKAALYDVSGKPVPMSLSPTPEGYRVYSQHATPGLYLLHLLTPQGAFTKRIILE